MVTIIPITNKCNQMCVYCSAHGREDSPKEYILKQINLAKDHLIITGGETTLSPDLIKYIKKAKEKDLYVELQSNGTMFYYKDFAKRVVDAGVDLFNIAMQSHIKETYNRITQTKGLLPKKIQGIKNLLDLNAKVRITCVINKLNYTELEEFSKHILENFDNIFLLEFNFIKALGLAEKNKEIVPTYEQVSPYLINALKLCKGRFRILIDHIPLCYIKGFEENHADVFKITNKKNKDFFSEKTHLSECKQCTLNSICLGPRKDYLEVYTPKLIPSNKDPDKITQGATGKSEILINDDNYKNPVKNIAGMHVFKLGQLTPEVNGVIDQIYLNFDKLIENNTSFELIDFPVCLFRPYKRYIKKSGKQQKIEICNDCIHSKDCFGFNKIFLDEENKLKMPIINKSSILTDNEKCMLQILNHENNISTQRILELTPNFLICADCAGGANVMQAGEKLINKKLVGRELKNKGYIWRLVKNEN